MGEAGLAGLQDEPTFPGPAERHRSLPLSGLAAAAKTNTGTPSFHTDPYPTPCRPGLGWGNLGQHRVTSFCPAQGHLTCYTLLLWPWPWDTMTGRGRSEAVVQGLDCGPPCGSFVPAIPIHHPFCSNCASMCFPSTSGSSPTMFCKARLPQAAPAWPGQEFSFSVSILHAEQVPWTTARGVATESFTCLP